jgi:hypothetical protein
MAEKIEGLKISYPRIKIISFQKDSYILID